MLLRMHLSNERFRPGNGPLAGSALFVPRLRSVSGLNPTVTRSDRDRRKFPNRSLDRTVSRGGGCWG
jgi:hypothetical protein